MRRLFAGAAVTSVVLALGACGGSSDEGATTTASRQAASTATNCGNSPSTSTALLVSNRLDKDIVFKAGNVYCVQWSENGNPNFYSGRTLKAGQTGYWGLEAANTRTGRHRFDASFTTNSAGTSLLSSPPLTVTLQLDDKDVTNNNRKPSAIITSPAGGAAQRNAMYVVGSLDGQQVRMLTGVVKNPGDGSWTGSAARADWGFQMRFQYVR